MLLLVPGLAPGAGTPGDTPVAVATFHALGLYWRPAEAAAGGEARVRYRRAGDWEWKPAHPLWFDGRVHPERPERSREYRGSIVGLAPGTTYEVEVEAAGETARLRAATWSERFPIGATQIVEGEGLQPLTITRSGKPGAYLLYGPRPGRAATIDGEGAPFNVVVDGAYVVLRGMTLTGAGRHAILLGPRAHHVVIEDNDISGWGRVAEDGFGIDGDSAISNVGETEAASDGIRAIVIQNNRIHHPRAGANDWTQHRALYGSSHPAGPQAITLQETGGNHVIRYNEIFSETARSFNDGIGGGENFGYGGGPGPDSDIYGNSIADCWDDGIESEGGNANVRIWGNLIDRAYVMIAASPTTLGPLYVFRNVARRARYSPRHPFGTGVFLKAQSREERGRFWGGGRVLIYNNTLYRPGDGPGIETGVAPFGTPLLNYVVRNNLFDTGRLPLPVEVEGGSSRFDHNLYGAGRGGLAVSEPHAVGGRPRYDTARVPDSLALSPDSPGAGDGVPIPNFAEAPAAAAPDRGAQQRGRRPLRFGIRTGRLSAQLTDRD